MSLINKTSITNNSGGRTDSQWNRRTNTTVARTGAGARSLFTSGGISRSSVCSKKSDSESRKSLRVPVRLVDAMGHDYTPLQLLTDEKRLKDTERDMGGSDQMSQIGSLQQTAQTQANTMSSFQTIPYGITGTKSQISSGHSPDSHSDMSDEILDAGGMHQSLFTEMKHKPEPVKDLTDKDLAMKVKINIRETDTIWMLDMPPVKISSESEDTGKVQARNLRYLELVKSRGGNDRYINRGMNTFDNPQISKLVQTDKIILADSTLNTTGWDIYDSYLDQEKDIAAKADAEREKQEDGVVRTAKELANAEEQKELEETSMPESKREVVAANEGQQATDKDSVSSDGDSDVFGMRMSVSSFNSFTESSSSNELILKSENLQHNLFIMERALNLNSYEDKLAIYRGINFVPGDTRPTNQEISTSSSESLGHAARKNSSLPQLERLWSYRTASVDGCNITGMAWNRQNPDILAVGYGQYQFQSQKTGCVCCWSLKNVEYPERIYYLPSGVTAIDWSSAHSNLLAVGMYDGVIYVFDARKRSNVPVIDTVDSSGRHLGPVRQLQWVSRESGDTSEVLVSVSNDGRVTQWSIKKGFESTGNCDFHYDLMKLKKISTRIPDISRQRKSDALISRYAYGTSLAFNAKDKSIYLVGTEDGYIHKCSCSYNEQYLENFFGHTGPIYAIRWSPFVSDVFLTCSADWTVKLWHLERSQPIINIQSNTKAIQSICWSPKLSAIFALVSETGIEVWNLQVSTLDPCILMKNWDENRIITSVEFSHNSDSLLVGDSEGCVNVYQMHNMPTPPKNQEAVLERVIESCIASQLSKT